MNKRLIPLALVSTVVLAGCGTAQKSNAGEVTALRQQNASLTQENAKLTRQNEKAGRLLGKASMLLGQCSDALNR